MNVCDKCGKKILDGQTIGVAEYVYLYSEFLPIPKITSYELCNSCTKKAAKVLDNFIKC